MPMATARWRTASRPYYPALFMTVRRESAESPSETSGEPARHRLLGRAGSCGVTGQAGSTNPEEPVPCRRIPKERSTG